MGDYKEEIKVSDTPLLAGEEWKEIKSDKKIPCGSCGSENTVCIYREGMGSIIGYYKDEEYYCRDCKKFTSIYIDYDS